MNKVKRTMLALREQTGATLMLVRGKAIIIIIVILYSFYKGDLTHLYLGRDISTPKHTIWLTSSFYARARQYPLCVKMLDILSRSTNAMEL